MDARAIIATVRLALLVVLFVPACGGPAWRVAADTDTSAAYLAFLAAHPDSAKAKAARTRAEERLWAEATASRSPDAYRGYVAAFPDGPHAAEAHTIAEQLAFEAAVTDGSSSALSAFLARYPTGTHAAEAQAALERSWVAEARAAGTEEAWGRYLVRYPDGAHADEAREERDRIAWNATTDANTLAAYETYLDRYLAGSHREEAEAFVAATRVGELQPVLALSGTFQSSSQHVAILARLQTELEKGLLVDLKKSFTIRPTLRVIAVDPGTPPPQQAVPSEPGVGVLLVVVEERKGREFQPSGTATDLHASVKLFVPPTATPVVAETVKASTPERVTGTAESTLYTSAVKAFGATLREVAPRVETFRVPK